MHVIILWSYVNCHVVHESVYDRDESHGCGHGCDGYDGCGHDRDHVHVHDHVRAHDHDPHGPHHGKIPIQLDSQPILQSKSTSTCPLQPILKTQSLPYIRRFSHSFNRFQSDTPTNKHKKNTINVTR